MTRYNAEQTKTAIDRIPNAYSYSYATVYIQQNKICPGHVNGE